MYKLIRLLNLRFYLKITDTFLLLVYQIILKIIIDFVKKRKGIPLFINQVHYVGLADEGLFILNHSLINYCKEREIYCIDLGKKFKGQLSYWYDDGHTTPLGSRMIAETVINELLEIVDKESFF